MLAGLRRIAAQLERVAVDAQRELRQFRRDATRQNRIGQAAIRVQLRIVEQILGPGYQSEWQIGAKAATLDLTRRKRFEQRHEFGNEAVPRFDPRLVGRKRGVREELGPLEVPAKTLPMMVAGDAD